MCSNGLIIGKSKIEIKERHGQGLDLQEISERLRPAFETVKADRKQMEEWQCDRVEASEVKKWADCAGEDSGARKPPQEFFISATPGGTLNSTTHLRRVPLLRRRCASAIASPALQSVPQQDMCLSGSILRGKS